MKFVMNWLAKEDNRLACFGGAGAKAAYGGKSVVKPATAYNALAQAVNGKFGTSWDGESAKSRVRTMKSKFHSVFALSQGKVSDESDSWKLSDAEIKEGIHTLLDKAQHMCPHWNSWFEWCGSDPNLLKHGGSESTLDVEFSDEGDEGGGDDDGSQDEEEGGPASFAAFSALRTGAGDEGNVGIVDAEGGVEALPVAVSSRVEPAPGVRDDLKAQQQQRKIMLQQMSAEDKKKFHAEEQKQKRQRESDQAEQRRRDVSGVPASPVSASSQPDKTSSSLSSPFAPPKGGDWQAVFLADRAHTEDRRADSKADSDALVAKMQLAATAAHNASELAHKREMMSWQQQQAQQALQMQQHQHQMTMMMKQHEMYLSSLLQVSKCKSDFFVAGLQAKVSMAQLESTAASMFPPLPPPPGQ